LECAVVLEIFAIALAIFIVLSGVCVFAIDRIKPGWLRIQAGAGRRFTFSIEMGQVGTADKPREEHRELEAGRDKPRELEAGSGRDSSEPSDAADQDNAAA
jgi:hypothetical protein